MAFSTAGLAAAVADAISKLGTDLPTIATMTPEQAFVRGYARGADYAFPIDEAGAPAIAMAAFLNTPANFSTAVVLTQTENTAVAAEAAGDISRTAANTAQETAVTAAGTAITSSGF